MVRIAGRDEGLVEHELGGLEAGVDVAVRPFLRRLADRQLAVAGRGEIARRPLQRLQLDAADVGDVAVEPRVGAARIAGSRADRP